MIISKTNDNNADNMLEYFDDQFRLASDQIKVPFIQRKNVLKKDDPSEAISCIIGEAQILENTLRQCIEMGGFVLERNKELIEENRQMQYSFEHMQNEYNTAMA